MRKGFNPHFLNDALRGERLSAQPGSRQMSRVMDRVLTIKPRMSGKRQTLTEMEIRDEMARRKGNRIRWF